MVRNAKYMIRIKLFKIFPTNQKGQPRRWEENCRTMPKVGSVFLKGFVSSPGLLGTDFSRWN